ncbi:MAG: sugar transferase [Lachnospiraceae bacterium]|nr:sugar transferase [Lachnospiraceae bacterium]
MLLRSRQFRITLLLFVDMLSVLLAYFAAGMIRFDDNREWFSTYLYSTTFVIFEVICLTAFMINRKKQDYFLSAGRFQNIIYVFQNVTIMAVMGIFYLFATQTAGLISRYFVGFFYLGLLIINILLRFIYREFLLKVAGNDINATNIMLVALKNEAPKIVRKIQDNRGNLINISCITIIDFDCVGKRIEGIPVVGNKDNYLDTHRENVYDEVFIHIPYTYEFSLKKLILGFEQMGVTVNLNIDMYNLDTREKTIRSFGEYSVISYMPVRFGWLELFLKRLMDIVGSIVGLFICFICFLIFGPVIKLTSPGPVFFSQTRVGINGRRFKIYKFRSMYQDAEERKAGLMKDNEMQGLMFKMENDPRITPVGRFLRKSSIDELPQFLNVLKGDMSLVGTRPPTVDEYEQYEAYHMRRLSIRPGITGLWQVSGRSDISDFEEVVRLDLKYIDQWSLLLDIRLIFMTVGIVLFRKGAR